MTNLRAVITDHGFPNLRHEESILGAAGIGLTVAQCKTTAEVGAAARGAVALLVQWAPVDAGVIAGLDQCKIIVRYGIGYDNVDIAAARARGIPVCNVPDYGVHEVAEHAVALALALARQLPQIDARLRRAEGHLRTVIRMIEGERACVEVAQQLHAIEKAIAAAKKTLIHDHVDHCLAQAAAGTAEQSRAATAEFRDITKYL